MIKALGVLTFHIEDYRGRSSPFPISTPINSSIPLFRICKAKMIELLFICLSNIVYAKPHFVKKTHQLDDESANETNHASSRVPYLSCLCESQKRWLRLGLYFWHYHLQRKGFKYYHAGGCLFCFEILFCGKRE